MKDKRITIIHPAFLKILGILKNEKIPGICANIHCDYKFIFSGSFIIKKMVPHIEECKKREEKRGSYKWIVHYCEKCNKKFVWDLPIYWRLNEHKVEYRYELRTMKYLAPFNKKGRKLYGRKRDTSLSG